MTPEGLLMWVRDQLPGLAPSVEIWSGESIRLKFEDPPDIDIFAGYTLGPSNEVNFPRVGTAWYRTNPVAVDQQVIEANKRLNGRLLPPLLLLKCWNEQAGHHCSSFHLELLIARFYQSLGKPLPFHVYEFLAAGAKAGPGFLSIPTPCGFITDLSKNMAPGSIQAVMEAFRTGAVTAERGLRAMMAGDQRTAVQQWTTLFGPNFPRLEAP